MSVRPLTEPLRFAVLGSRHLGAACPFHGTLRYQLDAATLGDDDKLLARVQLQLIPYRLWDRKLEFAGQVANVIFTFPLSISET